MILVADRTKFGKPSLISMIPLDVVRTIVTDAPVPEEAREVVNTLNIELLTAELPVEK